MRFCLKLIFFFKLKNVLKKSTAKITKTKNYRSTLAIKMQRNLNKPNNYIKCYNVRASKTVIIRYDEYITCCYLCWKQTKHSGEKNWLSIRKLNIQVNFSRQRSYNKGALRGETMAFPKSLLSILINIQSSRWRVKSRNWKKDLHEKCEDTLQSQKLYF